MGRTGRKNAPSLFPPILPVPPVLSEREAKP
jgi:hypothetical protein